MKQILAILTCCAFTALLSTAVLGQTSQQVIGSFPQMDGGFEGQNTGTLASASSFSGTTTHTDWTTSSASLGTINTGTARTGSKYMNAFTTSTAKRWQSPSAASGAITTSTAYIIQYYYRSSGATGAGYQIGGVSTDGTSQPIYSTAGTLASSGGVWTKISATVNSSSTAGTYGIGVIRYNTGTMGNAVDVDDFVVYAGSTPDVTAPDAPTGALAGSPTTSSLGVSWTAPGTGVDGGGYMVVRKQGSDPTTTPNANGIYAVGNTVAAAEQVVYLGTATSFTDGGLTSGTQYYYRVYTVDKAFNYSTASSANGTTNVIVPSITLASSNPAVSAGNILQGTTKNVLYKFTLAVTTLSATLNQVDFTTAGTYLGTDVTKYQLWYKTSDDISTATQIGSDITTALDAGLHSFTGLTQSIASGATGYLWVTTDVSGSGTIGNTINVSALTTANVTFASGTKSGTAFDGGTQTITVLTSAPVLNSPIGEGATSVSGTSSEADGTTITVYVNGSSIGTTTVLSGAWTKSGMVALIAGQLVKATATATGKLESAFSNTVTVQAYTAAPTVSSPIGEGSTSVSGTSSEADGTSIDVYVNGSSVGTTTVLSTAWTKTGMTALTVGQLVKAKATAATKLESGFSNTVTVEAVTSAPVVTSPIGEGATSVSGTSTEANGTTIDVYVNGSSVGTTTVSSNAWTKTAMTALTAGQLVKAKATASGKLESAFSNAVTVQAYTSAPTVGAPIGIGATSVSGTSSEADATIIDVYVDGSSVGTTTVSSGAWTKTGLTALTIGQLVKAKATAPGKLESGFSGTVTVTAALSISTSSPLPNATAGASYGPVTLTASGGTAPYGNWLVVLGSLPSGMSLSLSTGDITGAPTVAGVYTFTASVTDAALAMALKAFSITVDPGPLDHFAIGTVSTPQVAGTAFSINLTAQDANNNTITTFTGTVGLSTTAGTISPATSGSFSGGLRSENVTVTQSGTGKTITADGGSGHTGTSNTFDVNAGVLHHFAITTISSPQIAGTAFGITVTAQDLNNNTVTGFTGTVPLSTSAGGISPATSGSFTLGVRNENVTLTLAGTARTIGVDDGAGHTATSNSFDVNPGALDHFAIGTITGPKIQGIAFNITLTAQDANNNTVSFAGTVTISLSSGTISPTTSGSFSSGTRTESVTISTTGTGLTVGVDGGSGHTGTSNAFDVNAPTAYRSAGSGPWNVNGSWESFDGVNWVGASSTPTSTDGLITIRSGHTITVSASVAADQLTVDAGGTLAIAASQTLTIANGSGTDLTVNGTVTNAGVISLSSNVTASFNAGSKYTHNVQSNGVPKSNSASSITVTWDPTSTVEIIGLTSVSGVSGMFTSTPITTWGNVTWNTPSLTGSSLNLASSLVNIAGNLRVVSTGSTPTPVRFTASGPSGVAVSIGGDFIVEGGLWQFGTGTASSCALTIAGNYNQTGGTFAAGVSGGVIPINFTGTNKTFTQSGGTLTSTGFDWNVKTGASLTLLNGLAVDASRTFTVENGGTLNCGSNNITGGTFTLNSGGTLGIGSTAGITTSGATGNVQTTTRNFNTGGNYTYNGSSGQATGNGLPATVNNLTISNSAGVTLSGSTAVNGTLALTSGTLAPASFTLTANGSVTRSTGYVDGTLTRAVGSGGTPTVDFYVGTGARYTPISVAFTSTITGGGTLTANSTGTEHSDITNSGLNQTKDVNRFFTVTNNSIAPTNYGITLTWDPLDVDGGANTANFVVKKKDGSWASATSTPLSSTSIQATGLTSFSDFAVGEPLVAVSATPTVNSPITVGATSVSGTSSEADGTTITVYVDGSSVGTTTVSSNAWTKSGMTPLTAGQLVKATATASGKLVSPFSNIVTVQEISTAPVVSSPIGAGATSVSGTSTEADATVIEVYVDGLSVGTTTVSSGAWTKTGMTALTVGQLVKATATAPGKVVSTFSNIVTVQAVTAAPVVNSPIAEGATSVSGTSSEADGTTVDVYVNGSSVGTTTVASNAWTKSGMTALTAGQLVKAKATAGVKLESGFSNTVTVQAISSAPVVSAPIGVGATSVSGTSTEADATSIDVYVDGSSVGTTTVSSGAWTKTGMAALTVGQLVKAKATAPGKLESAFSNTVTVTAALTIATSSPLPAATAGTAYSTTLAAAGGTAPYSNWHTILGSLPAGLTMNLSTGEISGTPTTSGTSTFTAEVTDALTATASKAFNLTVNPGTLDHFAIGTISTPQVTLTPFSISITAQDANNNTVTGFTGTVTLSTTAGTISPTTSSSFSLGTLSQSVTVSAAGTGRTIGVNDGSGHTGTSNTFDVNALASNVVPSNGTGGGVWSSGSTWQGGIVPSSVDSVVIRGSDSVSVTGSTSCGGLNVQPGGKLGLFAKLVPTNVTLNGTMIVSVDTLKPSGTMTVGTFGTYRHAQNGGRIPIATWGTGSTLELTGITANSPANGKQNFYNIVWNSPSQSASLNLGWQPSVAGTDSSITINGDITVWSTGSGRWQMCAPLAGTSGAHSVARVTINGNVTVAGGSTLTSNGTSNGFTDVFITVLGNVSVSGAATQFAISRGSQGGTGTCVWNFKGALFSMGAGTTTQNSNPTGGKWMFSRAGGQTVTIDTLATLTGAVNFQFGDGSTIGSVDIGNSRLGGSACIQVVKAGEIVVVGPTGFIGGGTNTNNVTSTFTLENGATLVIAPVKGILSAGSSGAVQVSGTRSYGTGANYEYDGTNAQKTGGGLPATVNNLRINNAAGVTIDSTAVVTVNGTLTMNVGMLVTGSNVVSVPVAGTVSRLIGYVAGTLSKGIAAGSGVSKAFEIGDASGYTPVLLSFNTVTTPGTLTAVTTGGDHPQVAGSGLLSSKSVNRYYTLTNAGTAFDQYSAVFNFLAGDIDAGANTSNFIVAKYDVPTWSKPTVGARTATSTQATGLTSFSDFAIGEAALGTFTITASVIGGNGTIAPSGAVIVNAAANQVFTMTPAVGYHIDSVFVDGAYAGHTSPDTLKNVTANHTIAVKFAINTYTITASVIGGNGTILPSGAVSVNYGNDQAFTMTPAAGYHIDSVLIDGAYAGHTSPDTIKNVTANHTIAVKFAINTYTLTVNVVGSGSVSKNPDEATYNNGTSVQLTAIPADYTWQFTGWSGDITGTTNPLTVTIGANIAITATFTLDSSYLAAYRSFKPDSLAQDQDDKGKVGKFVKRKADKAYFIAHVANDTATVTGLHVEFGNAILTGYPFFTTPTSTHVSPDGKNKKWDFTFTAPVHHGDTVDVFGFGNKGKVQKVSKYYWENGTTLVGTKKKDPHFNLNDPKLPMPNRVNVLFETFAQSGFGANGLLIGRDRTLDSAKQYGWILAPKYTDAQKSLSDKSGLHTGAAKGFDKFTSGKAIVKRQKSIPPGKQNNMLIADMIALKLNIAASTLEKTPLGFGELIYSDSVRIPTGTVNILNGKMIKEIAAFGDSAMMGYYGGTHIFAADSVFKALDYAIQRINSAFEGVLDTLSFSAALHLKGTKELADVPYLRTNHEAVPAKLVPLGTPIVETPQAYKLYQNYPNPFNPTTTIQFDLMEQSVVTLKIYNILGQEVATLLDRAMLDDGTQELEFSAQSFASGVYFYRIVAEQYDEDGAKTATFQTVKKMMLLK